MTSTISASHHPPTHMQAAAILTFGCPPQTDLTRVTEDCHHPGLPHISDFTGTDPGCGANHPDGAAVCTMPPCHGGPHAAGNGDYITALWEPAPTDWDHWTPGPGKAVGHVWVTSYVFGDSHNIGGGGFTWYADTSKPTEQPTPSPDALAAFDAEVVAWAATLCRVRLVRLPVPAPLLALTHPGQPCPRQSLTDWIEARSDTYECTALAEREVIISPEDPEPSVRCIVQWQAWVNDYATDTGPAQVHDANPALRVAPRAVLAGLEDHHSSSDDFAHEHGWLDGHDGPSYSRFVSAQALSEPGVPTGCTQDTPEAIRAWLSWADRHRHLLGQP